MIYLSVTARSKAACSDVTDFVFTSWLQEEQVNGTFPKKINPDVMGTVEEFAWIT